MKRVTAQHFVSFDGQEVVVRTRDSRVSNFVSQTYEHMLTETPRFIVGEVSVYSDGNLFEVRRSGKSGLTAEEPVPLFPQIVDDVLQEFMDARPELLWLHAGVVEWEGRALIIPAKSGAGKSTFTTALVEQGWKFMSDDTAPILLEGLSVLSYPQSPRRRRFPGAVIGDGAIGNLEREIVSIPKDTVHLGAADVKAMLFPRFGAGPGGLSPLSAGEAAFRLLGSVRNFPDHREAAIKAMADLTTKAELYQFDYDHPDQMNVLFGQRKESGFFLAK